MNKSMLHLFEQTKIRRLRRCTASVMRDVQLSYMLPHVYRAIAKRSPVNPLHALFIHRGQLDGMTDYRAVDSLLQTEYGFTTEHISLGYGSASMFEYYRRCRICAAAAATAGTVFLNDVSNLVSCLPLRPETSVVQLWHACGAFKKWGMSTADKEFGGSRAAKEKHPAYRNLSLVSVSSAAVAPAYIEAMSLENSPHVVQAIGVARTDAFFAPTFSPTARSAVETAHPLCKGRKIVLYAPTFRGKVLSAKAPNCLDVGALQQKLEDEFFLLIRHHPFVRKVPPLPQKYASFAAMADDTLTTEQLLGAADMLVTDYSSVIFEYSLLGRPMAFLSCDLDSYDSERGWYYGYEDFVPGPIFTESEPLAAFIAQADSIFDFVKLKRFRETYMSACDGNAAHRICDWVAKNG